MQVDRYTEFIQFSQNRFEARIIEEDISWTSDQQSSDQSKLFDRPFELLGCGFRPPPRKAGKAAEA